MPEQGGFSPIGRMLVATAAAVAVLAGMRAAAPILAPVLIALVITIAWSPAAERLRERGWNPTAAAAAGIVAGIAVVGLLVALVWVSLLQLQDKLPEYQPKIAALQAMITEKMRIIPFDTGRIFSIETFQPGNLVGYGVRIIRRLTQTAGDLLVLVLLIAFMMLEATGFPSKLRSAFATNPPVLESFRKFGEGIKSYVLINAAFGFAAAVINTILLLVLGVDFAFLWGVLSFLLSFVPNIGFIVALIPPAVLALIESGVARALIVLGGYTAINVLVDNVIKPRFVGHSLGLSPLIVVLSLLFWGWLLGPLGALIAIPMSIGLKLLLESFEESRWMAVLMSDRASRESEQSNYPTTEAQSTQRSTESHLPRQHPPSP